MWIAFKKLYLWYSEQLKASFFKQLTVVNCFQKIVSLIFWTTKTLQTAFKQQLWIAFKKLYLWYSEQPMWKNVTPVPSCELLSKNCIFDILNNIWISYRFSQSVVNCFQKIVSLIFWTTMDFPYLSGFRCELLSKNCIFDILNNLIEFHDYDFYVVNCFQKIVSLIFWTTIVSNLTFMPLLWIAFKKLYLWYSEQRCAER